MQAGSLRAPEPRQALIKEAETQTSIMLVMNEGDAETTSKELSLNFEIQRKPTKHDSSHEVRDKPLTRQVKFLLT